MQPFWYKSTMAGWAPALQRVLVQKLLGKQRIIRDRHDLYSDANLRRKFRFGKESLIELVEWIDPDMFLLAEHHFAIPGLIRLCVFLQFMGSGAL